MQVKTVKVRQYNSTLTYNQPMQSTVLDWLRKNLKWFLLLSAGVNFSARTS